MLRKRSSQKELIDLGSCYYTLEEYTQCMKKMFTINKLLGFFRRTKLILKKFPKQSTVLDIGCGNGDFLLNLSQLFPTMSMRGIDIAEDAILLANNSLARAKAREKNRLVSFQLVSTSTWNLASESIDIILATLVCHHLQDDEIILFLQEALQSARKLVIIHDLERHRIAYWLYKLFSPLLFNNRLITHDGAISILRGFTKKEWQQLLQKAGIKKYQLRWHFPFCWSLFLWKN